MFGGLFSWEEGGGRNEEGGFTTQTTSEENLELGSTREPTVKRNLDNFLFSSLLFELFV